MAKKAAKYTFLPIFRQRKEMPKVINPVPRFNYHNQKEVESYIIARFRYSYKGKSATLKYSTGLKIQKKFWNFESQEPKTHISTNQIKSYLISISKTILEVFTESKGNLSPKEFRDEIDYRLNKKVRPEQEPEFRDFLNFFQFFIEQKKAELKTGEIQEGTIKKFKSIHNKVERYFQETGQELSLEEINLEFRQNFIEWCIYSEENQTNTVNKYLKAIKQIVTEAKEQGFTENSIPEKKWYLKAAPTSDIALSMSEVQAIFNLDLQSYPEGYQKARQLFLIGAYTGLRWGDYSRIAPNYIELLEGREIIKVITQKTRKRVSVPIHPALKAILEECNYQSPELSQQKTNEYIKEVGRLAGITQEVTKTEFRGNEKKEVVTPKYKRISTHTARRTFVTIAKEIGMPSKVIRSITGHATEKQMNEYDKKSEYDAMLEYLQTMQRG